ncbi:uncharacterized protein LOC111446740 isoform X1 [Cucurbita moschata]|uniref:Uncharacterized protein LOC111446740 isoform X1 n=1 Tax=Cucurbita moschata TaxID=3662 RepID=A0A6J1FTP5_CUCMO|nr:uncharacterized protein LOC111446740 isoform X1 [Cucurbita moschata]
MKLCRLLVMLFVLHTSLLLLFFSSSICSSSSSDMTPNQPHVVSNECLSATPSNRKLKVCTCSLEDNDDSSPGRKNVRVDNVNLYDYSPIDPVPSSKRSIKHGPIEHRSPLIPYMPNPSPPDQPQPGGFV